MATLRLPIGSYGSSYNTSQREEAPRVPPFSFLSSANASHATHASYADEIYITSSSLIAIDAPLSSIGSDSGIYNTSTEGSNYSGLVVKGSGTYDLKFRTTYPDLDNVRTYIWEDVCLWLDAEKENTVEGEVEEEEEEEEVYQTIYDIIGQNGVDSDFDEDPRRIKPLTSMVSAAGRKIKKLRRNWSMKKNDLSKGLSKIRRSSQSSIFYREESSQSSIFYREESSNFFGEESRGPASFNSDMNVPGIGVRAELTGSDNTSFQIILTVDLDNTYMQMTGRLPVPPRRRKSRRITQVIRPNVPPPAPPVPPLPLTRPPIPLKPTQIGLTKTMEPVYQDSLITSSLNLPDRFSKHYPEILPKPKMSAILNKVSSAHLAAESSLEGSYASTLLNSEPLYQFYDGYVTMSGPDKEHTYESVYNTKSLDQSINPSINQSIDQIKQTISKPFNLAINEVSNPQINQETNCDQSCSQHLESKISETEDIEEASLENLKPAGYNSEESLTRSSALEMLTLHGKRTLWSEIPEVKESGVLLKMSSEERKLQEAKFEILSSEASYLKSLNILTSHFLTNLATSATERDIATLFSHVYDVQNCSGQFLAELDIAWRQSFLLPGVLRILLEHARRDFHVYIKYCSNQIHQDKTLRKLMSENSRFVEVLRELESSQTCQSLSLHSFLMLPMQRVTRLPLLVSALQGRLPSTQQEYHTARECIEVLNCLVEECNEGARSVYRMEELICISKLLDFRELRAIALISSSRYLVKQGEVSRIQWKESTESVRLTFGKRNSRQNLVIYLFSDLLVISKKKSDDKYAVIDYCNRNLVQISSLNREESPVPGLPENSFPVWITLLQNHEHKTQEMLLYFQTETDRRNWISLLSPSLPQDTGEVVYAEWDSPRVEFSQACNPNSACAYSVGDTARVLKKIEDKYLVEVEADKRQFWIQQNLTRELVSDHLRAKNFKQRYQFLKSISQDA